MLVTKDSFVSEPSDISNPDARESGQSLNCLLPLVYEDLRKLAAHRFARLAPGQTLQPTALVHEAWLRLAAAEQRTWRDPAHFLAAAVEVMRHVLVDHVRRQPGRISLTFSIPCAADEAPPAARSKDTSAMHPPAFTQP